MKIIRTSVIVSKTAIFNFILCGMLFSAASWADESTTPTTIVSQGEPTKSVEQEWNELRESVQKRLNGAGMRDAKLKRTIMDELSSFAERHEYTDQAALALFNRGWLAVSLNDFEQAEKDMQAAKEQTSDPKMIEKIDKEWRWMNLHPGGAPPAFEATDLNGYAISLDDYKGEVVLLDFWATWCGPCVRGLPNLKQVYQRHHEKGFEVISVSLDRDRNTLRNFIRDNDMPWKHIYNKDLPSKQDLSKLYNVESIPQMFLIGRDGRIQATDLRGPRLEKAVSKALN